MHRGRRLVPLFIALLLAAIPLPGNAEGPWLDGAPEAWNTPGLAVPAAPAPPADDNQHCRNVERPAETAEDEMVAAQGWRLFSAYQRGWGVTLVGGFVNFDAMCRPILYQQFVFVDGVFAGTLAPEAMVPRTDGALTDAHISGADSLYAVYDRYGPSAPLCCPSGETALTFKIDRSPQGPVVLLDSPPAPVLPATPAATPVSADAVSSSTTFPVCVGLGGDALSLVFWTADEIAKYEERAGPIVHAHPETGTCQDPAGLPILRNAAPGFAWVCLRTFAGDWYGPVWTAKIYLPADALPPDPAIGGCPLPRDQLLAATPQAEQTATADYLAQQAAATAVYLSQLEADDDLATLLLEEQDKLAPFRALYAWLHPDAQTVVPESVVVGWYDERMRLRRPAPISIISVDLEEWTWEATGTTYPLAAKITYEQTFADDSVERDVMHLVQDDHGLWRWFFGRDRAFVEEQIGRFANQESAG